MDMEGSGSDSGFFDANITVYNCFGGGWEDGLSGRQHSRMHRGYDDDGRRGECMTKYVVSNDYQVS